jgi:alpha-mannosidase
MKEVTKTWRLIAPRVPRLPQILLAFGLLTASSSQALDPTKDKVLYMVANAHLDDQWNWTIQDTINSYIPKTLSQNFAYFEAYTNYTFSFEEAWRYQLINEYYPASFVTLSNYIAQGRWRVTGSAMVAGDMNVPAPESLIRQILYANTYWKQQFNKTSVDIFLPDCFGFGYALPSVAAHCGLKGFSSQKLSWGSAVSVPFQNIGRWIGPDGTSIVAVVQPGAYTTSIMTNLANDPNELARLTNIFNQTGLYLDYRYFGTGDTGGSPTLQSVTNVCQSAVTTNGAVNVMCAGADQVFRDLTDAQIAMLPTYRGELLMQTHGTGCYTAHSELKKYNRQCEQGAAQAECAAVIADWLQGGGAYPQERLNAIWARFLWHQFHDDLTGTSIPQAYTFSWNDYLLSLNELKAETRSQVGVLARALDTTVGGVPLVVFNPLSIPRTDVVEATVTFDSGAPAAVRVFDGNGNEVASQMGTPTGNAVPVIFVASVPSMGASVYEVRPSASASALTTGLSVTTSQVENARYRVRINANGDVSSILDKANNRELLSAPIRWDFLNNRSTSWPAWEVMYSDLVASPVSYLSGPVSCAVLENGPARACLAVTRYNGGSSFTERIRLAAGAAGDRVEWDVSADWQSPATLLKMEFPLAVTNSKATFDLGLGTIQRGNVTSSLYEVPAQQWADLGNSNGTYGVSIMNDSKYGWDKPNNYTLRQTIFHTPAVGGGYVYEATNSFGTHRMLLAVMGHTNGWAAGGTPQVAARLNQPLQAFQTSAHAGTLGKQFSLVSCNNSNVAVRALKKAESSTEVVVRLQELAGATQSATLSFAAPLLSARQVTGTEETLASLTPAGTNLTVSLGAYQPVTVAVTLGAPGSKVPAPACAAVALPYNMDGISTDANRTDGNFYSGYTYPAELVPSTIKRGGISFQMGPTNDGSQNVVRCQGQTLPLSPGYDHLYLLAAAASNDVSGAFTLGSYTTNLTVRNFTGFIGQWDGKAIKRDEIGWICTHRHNGSGNNEAYNFCYLFKYCLDIPPGATTVTLPNVPNLRIFAATLATNSAADTLFAGGRLGENLLPWADAGSDRVICVNTTNSTALITLDGAASSDPDGAIISYVWSQNGTVLGTGTQITMPLPVGTNVVSLTVTDNQGGSSQVFVTLIVLPALTVTAIATPTNASTAPLAVQFAGVASGGVAVVDTVDDQPGVISAQDENSPGEAASHAFDNDLSSKWLDFADAYPSTRQSWLQYQYSNGVQRLVTNYTITSGNDSASYPARNPAAWRLLGSNDGGTNWATLDTQTGQTFSSSQQTRDWTVANPGYYNAYRLAIDSVYNPSSANSVQLDELQLLGPPVFSYWWFFGDGGTSTNQNPQHTYTNAGSYLVRLGVTSGLYAGTNTALVTIGAPLLAAFSSTPALGATPLTVIFSGQASGGNGARTAYDTTDDLRGTITAQGDNPPNESRGAAFDGTSATKWLDFANSYSSARSSWIQYQYADGQRCSLKQYTVTSANDSQPRDPAAWRLLGSNDGGTNWTQVDLQTDQVFASRYLTRCYAVTNQAAFNAFRYVIDTVYAPASANSVQLSELQLIGNSAYSYLWAFGDGATSTAQNPQHTYVSNGTYTVTLAVSDGAALAVTSSVVKSMPLYLGAIKAPTGRIGLSWPVWSGNCTLYSTTDLKPPVSWSKVTNVPVAANGTNTVVLAGGEACRFFQLRP